MSPTTLSIKSALVIFPSAWATMNVFSVYMREDNFCRRDACICDSQSNEDRRKESKIDKSELALPSGTIYNRTKFIWVKEDGFPIQACRGDLLSIKVPLLQKILNTALVDAMYTEDKRASKVELTLLLGSDVVIPAFNAGSDWGRKADITKFQWKSSRCGRFCALDQYQR